MIEHLLSESTHVFHMVSEELILLGFDRGSLFCHLGSIMNKSVLIFQHKTQLHNMQIWQFHYRLKADLNLNTKLSEDAFCFFK